eukprot:TRINITY_DN2634_c0_g2_i2.p1 TRINITY_DN2634_c0_g2~~TRINITY_DN2634_c0_g2_i2.p1  ORF type:complete len:387 (-),score=80.77 TRINITY_DN2634_c0_g2_i2:66-1226(-)
MKSFAGPHRKMEGTAKEASGEQPRKKTRVWIDMCADVFHFGHANALRQAKEMADELVVGIHPDTEVIANKGPPVMNEQERLAVVAACKWVDEATLDAPYTTCLETLNKFNIDFAVHGEDISTNADGTDSFEEVKQAGKFKLIKRTGGVSTTDLVGRMLLMTKNHFNPSLDAAVADMQSPTSSPVPLRCSSTAISSHTFYQFVAGTRQSTESDKIVYIDGAFDLFHAGHVNALRQAKELGDFVLVGVHSDQDLNALRGTNFPIMNLHERALAVLSCKYVDEVLVGAPIELTDSFLDAKRISLVVHGDERDELHPAEDPSLDPYRFAKARGIYHEVKSTPGLSGAAIIERIIQNRVKFSRRNADRMRKDALIAEQQARKQQQQQEQQQ